VGGGLVLVLSYLLLSNAYSIGTSLGDGDEEVRKRGSKGRTS
jgi:hypothetical protein